ncbi:S9 family peptidase [Tundrisphaera sp. TA3]|uniref:S9 family peptidase n=1 Tax=Tundrisphaera sp. TA3 TaxID=3435775 RepID=UPI003EBD4898
MIPTRRRRAVSFALMIAFATLPAAPLVGGERRPIAETDLFRFAWAADPRISPDGQSIAYVRVAADRDKDDYESSIWMVPSAGGPPRRLTNGPRDTLPRWSPDGARLLFLRRGEGEKGKTQLFVLSLAGGEPRVLTELPEGVSAPEWSPDGKSIAFLSTTSNEDLARLQKIRERGKAAVAAERESDVRIVTRSEFRADHAGYRDPKHPAHIWILAVSADAEDRPAPRRITSGPSDEWDPQWAPDGRRLYFLSTRDPDPAHRADRGAIYSVAADGGPIAEVASIPGSISTLAPSPDGKRIAFRGTINEPARSYSTHDLFVLDLGAKQPPRNLTEEFEADVGSTLSGDQHPPRGTAPTRPIWAHGGSSLIDRVAREGRANLESFDVATGRSHPVTSGDQEVAGFSGSADGSKLAILASSPTIIGQLKLVEPEKKGEPRKLVDPNAALFAGLDLTPPEAIRYRSFDGREIEAWVQKPPRFDPKIKYPLILNIHGGPHAAYGYTFSHEFQWLAARGYVVLYPNPRGSSTYGEAFGNAIQHHYPGDDYKDLMAGVDELIRRGYIDPKKLGITGGSGGGMLTNWAITQTDRFAAAVSQRSIADWSAWWYAADFTLFRPTWFETFPFQDPARFAARSPITFVEKVDTPLMLIEGEADARTPPAAGGEAMFRALKALKKPTVMIRFPGETHDLSRTGKPWHRVERLQHMVNWFDKYLLGKPMPQYDPPPE